MAFRQLCILALAALTSACASLSPSAPTATISSADAGQEFAARACAGCHAVGVRGDSPNPHAPAFRDLARTRSDSQLAAALAAIARDGHVEMPPIYMTPDEQARVAAYLRGLTARRT